MSDFETNVRAFLDEFMALEPVAATAIGDHRHDSRWPSASPEGRAERAAFIDRWTATFASFDPTELSRDHAVDRDLLLGELDSARFDANDLQDDRWDPLHWVYLLGEGLFLLLAREFAPLETRLERFADRLEGMPAVVDDAIASLVGADDGRAVGRMQTEVALEQLGGVGELIDDALAQADEAGVSGDRLAAAAETARAALARFEAHLSDDLLPRATGDGLLGRDLFARKLRHTMRSDELTPERILAAADREFEAVRAEMIRLARDLWPAWRPDEAAPTDEPTAVRGVLDAIAAIHQDADDLIEFCRAENLRIEAFCRDHDLIGLTDEPMDIRWTPTFLRSFAGAMFISPGPLDRGLPSFFAITPMPDDWSPDRRESYLREDNDRMLRLLTIHEAVPGHYLQSVYGNRSPSLPRSIFASGLFAEGWAVYVTQVLMDAGYGADDPALMLTHWKFYLRSVTNAILDARVHVQGIGEEDAVTFMVDGGFQEEAEARAKYRRARLSSTQLSTYFAGSMEMWAIELDVRRRRAAGADPAAVVARDLPGGFGDTPGFRYRTHLESVISHGSPPTSLLRRLLLD